MTTKADKGRNWMWGFLAVALALQFYFVREFLTVFALFAATFLGITLLVAGAFIVQKTWEMGLAKVLESQSPVVAMGRRVVATLEDLAVRPFRRPI